MTKLLLVGPSSTIKNYGVDYLTDAVEFGYTICCYTGAIKHFQDLNFNPDYFSFIDPLTVLQGEEFQWFKSGNKNINLLYFDIYKNDLRKFFDIGFTCRRAQQEKKHELEQFKKLIIDNNFKQNFSKEVKHHIDLNPVRGNKPEINLQMDFSETYIFSAGKENADKFTSIFLPLILSHFKNISEIKCIGFGDFKHKERYQDLKYGKFPGADSFNQYLKWFDVLYPAFKVYFAKNNIDFNFEYPNTFSKKFDGTGNNIKPLKRK